MFPCLCLELCPHKVTIHVHLKECFIVTDAMTYVIRHNSVWYGRCCSHWGSRCTLAGGGACTLPGLVSSLLRSYLSRVLSLARCEMCLKFCALKPRERLLTCKRCVRARCTHVGCCTEGKMQPVTRVREMSRLTVYVEYSETKYRLVLENRLGFWKIFYCFHIVGTSNYFSTIAVIIDVLIVASTSFCVPSENAVACYVSRFCITWSMLCWFFL